MDFTECLRCDVGKLKKCPKEIAKKEVCKMDVIRI